MNLVALEYIACQEDRHGVLVLSEFAGVASFVNSGSILFNPSSADDISDALYKALTMEREERARNYISLRDFITTHTRSVFYSNPLLIYSIFKHADMSVNSAKWTETFLDDLSVLKKSEAKER